jgi:hypothetical protein
MQNAAKNKLKDPGADAQRARGRQPAVEASLILREVPGKGKGVFATRPYREGEIVLEFLGNLLQPCDVDDLTHCLQIGPATFLSPSGGIDDYVNHSCAPNTGIAERQGRILLFALGPIKKGDEISFDYSTTQTGGHWSMECLCGVPGCRGLIGDFRDVPAARRRYYIERQAVLPFVAADAAQV